MRAKLEAYLRLPFIVALFAIGLVLSFLSLTTDVVLVGEATLSYGVPPMADVLDKLNSTGELVRASSDVPEGIRIYLLTDIGYEQYNETGTLPDVFIDHEQAEVEVRTPSFVLIRNQLDEPVDIKLHVEIYEIHMPYAILAIPSYVLTLTAAVLLMARLIVRVREQEQKKEG